MNAGQTLVDSGMAGYNMGKQLADPKKLIKDIAIQQGKKALGMGLPKDYNKIDNHYNGYKKRKSNNKEFFFDQKMRPLKCHFKARVAIWGYKLMPIV
jgi:hypothetical protein